MNKSKKTTEERLKELEQKINRMRIEQKRLQQKLDRIKMELKSNHTDDSR